MAAPERDTYSTDPNRATYSRESSATGWFVGIIVALALLAIGYLVFSANTGPSTTNVNNAPAATTTTSPAPAAPSTGTSTTPMMQNQAPATPPASTGTATPATPAPATPAPATPAPATQGQ